MVPFQNNNRCSYDDAHTPKIRLFSVFISIVRISFTFFYSSKMKFTWLSHYAEVVKKNFVYVNHVLLLIFNAHPRRCDYQKEQYSQNTLSNTFKNSIFLRYFFALVEIFVVFYVRCCVCASVCTLIPHTQIDILYVMSKKK